MNMAIEKTVIGASFLMLLIITIMGKGGVNALQIGVPSDTNSSSVPAMYVLGDSSVDCGDNTPFYTMFHRNLSLLPCNGSDSSLLPQLLAQMMELPQIIPFYSQNGSIRGILNGVNFGSADASILYPGSRSYQSLNQQIRQVYETIQLLQLHLGEEYANHFVQSSLFYLSLGKDDIIDYFLDDSSGISLKHSGHDFSHILVHQMTNALRNLYTVNVRKIIVAGVLPLGCAPHILLKLENSSIDEGKGCFDEVNTLVLEYNTRLEEKLVSLNNEFSDSHIVFIDVYRAMLEFINNHKAYGFEDARNACCGLGSFGSVSGCISRDMACPQSSAHVWWDLYNPTPAVNALLADSAWSGQPLSGISRPLTIQQLYSSN